jgi:hypothetical protein
MEHVSVIEQVVSDVSKDRSASTLGFKPSKKNNTFSIWSRKRIL